MLSQEFVPAPPTKDAANAPLGLRGLVVFGGLLSAIFLLPTVPWLWLGCGAVLVPIVWIKSGKKIKAMMTASGCTTKAEWKAFVATLPTEKELKKLHIAHQTGSIRTLVQPSTPATTTYTQSHRNAAPKPKRYELNLPQYKLLAGSFANYEVVGEHYREKAVIRALGGLVLDVEKTVDDVDTHLIPEPENPYGDGHAVMVWMNGEHVGYLEKTESARFFPVLDKIVQAGYLPTTTGRLWGVQRTNYDGSKNNHLYARVALNEPELLVPTNEPPAENYSMLPWGTAIQVTKESDHLPELLEHLHGPDSYAYATLHQSSRTLKNGSVREYVTVCIDGAEIGELTPLMSEKIIPTVRHLNEIELVATTWARVKGSPLAIEVTLQITKAHEIPHDWFTEVPVTVPALSVHRNGSMSTYNADDSQESREKNWDF